MKNIDEKLNTVFNFISDYTNENGYPPTVRELCAKLDLSSTSVAHYYLKRLKDSGRILSTPKKNRAIITNKPKQQEQPKINKEVGIPILGTVSAGQGILAVESIEGYITAPHANFLPTETEEKFELVEDDKFALKVQGDSMIECGIFNGDYVIVQKQSFIQNGEIAVVFWDNQATVKRIFKRSNAVILHPENKTMFDIVLYDHDHPIILGKVIASIRKY